MSGAGEARLFSWGDLTLLLWCVGLLAVGVGGVLPWSLSWGPALLLDAGLLAAGVVFATFLARLIERRGRSPLFLLPSVRQLMVLLLPVTFGVQAWLIHSRPLSGEEIASGLETLQKTAADEPERAPDLTLRAATVALAQEQREGAESPQDRRRANDVIKRGLDPGQPLPAPLPFPAREEPTPGDETTTGAPVEPGSGAGGQSSPPDEPPAGRSPLETFLALVTGPFRALLGALFGLGGGEEYRRLATQVVLDLSQGQEPTPATLSEFLRHLDPAERKRAEELIRRFIREQKGITPVQRDHLDRVVARALVPDLPASSALLLLRELLARIPRPGCQAIHDELMRDGLFSSQREKDEILRELNGSDCLPLFQVTGVRGKEGGG